MLPPPDGYGGGSPVGAVGAATGPPLGLAVSGPTLHEALG